MLLMSRMRRVLRVKSMLPSSWYKSLAYNSPGKALSCQLLAFDRELSSVIEASPRIGLESPLEKNLFSRDNQFQNDIHMVVQQLFDGRCIPSRVFDSFIADNLHLCSVCHIADIMRFTGNKINNTNSILLRNHLRAISSRILELLSHDWSHKSIAHVMYGLNFLKESDCGVTEIIAMMTELVTRTIGNEDTILLLCLEEIPLESGEARKYISVVTTALSSCQLIPSGEHIGEAIHALKNVNCESSEVRALLCMLATKLKSSHFMDVNCLRNALHGVTKMDSDVKEVLTLISALTLRIHDCEEFNTSHDISNTLMGLSRMRCDSLEVRALLACMATKLQNCSNRYDPRALSKSLSGLQRMKSDCQEMRALLSALAEKAKECKKPFDSFQLSSAMSGLQGFSSDQEEVRALLTSLTPLVLKCKDSLSSEQIGNAVHGLQGMTSDSTQALFLISALAHQTFYCKDILTSKDVGNAMYGFQGMSSEKNEVRALVAAFTTILKRSIITLQSHDIGRALYGLKRMNCDSEEMTSLLSCLILRVERCTNICAEDISNSLYGLQKMKNEDIHVYELVCTLALKLNECDQKFSNEMISNSLYGLQGMSSGDHDMDLLLPLLTAKIKSCNDDFTVKDVSNCLYGLQCMSSNCHQVQLLVKALTPKIRFCDDEFTIQSLGKAFYGLQGILAIPETDLILRFLYKQLKKLFSTTAQFTLVETHEFMRFGQNVLLMLPFLREEPSVKDVFRKLEKIQDSLLTELADRKKENRLMKQIPSFQELEIQTLIENSLKNSNVSVTFNEYVLDFFDVDIVLRNSIEKDGLSNESITCIIIDELDYDEQKTKRFSYLKDQYFLSKGIVIEHIKADVLYDMTEKELKLWLQKNNSQD